VPIATTDEQRAVGAAVRAWAQRTQPVATARAQEDRPDAWREHWADLAGLGVFAAAVPEAAGGAGGSIADLAVLVEQCADALVPGPVVTSALAAVLLARSGSALADSVADGSRPVGLALGSLSAAATGDGLTLNGSVPNVLGADAGTVLLSARLDAGEAWFLVDVDVPGVKVLDQQPADFSRSLGEVRFVDVEIAASDVLFGVDTALVTDLVATLFAAEAAGVAAWCMRTAVDYAKLREQFGKPIGSFQAIKHLCAEMLCRVELATAVAWDAAQAIDDPAQRPIAAATAAAVALDAAVETAKDCIQVLGGIGFTWEHDAHLYLRRALALRQLLGGSAAWRRRVAQLTLAGVRRELAIDVDCPPAFRDAAGADAERIAALPAAEQRAALADAGYLAPSWPTPYGRGASVAEQLVIDEELTAHGVIRPDLVIAGWAIPTILRHGSPEQIERFTGPTLRGEIVWCQLFSEPGAGSDLAALRTRAEKVDGGWRLRGQKVWTSVAREAHFAICLARTDPDAPKHKGISYFLVNMSAPGIDIRPLREITGQAVFNEVFLDDVFVPDDMLVGEVNNGWKLARATLVNERIAIGGGSSIGEEVEALLALAADRGASNDQAILEQLGGLVSQGVAGSVLGLRSTLRQLDGKDGGAESSVRKLVGVRHRQAVAELGLDLLGSDGAVAGEQLQSFLLTRCLSIAGGTTQVLLTLAAERILGLPRD